MTENKKNQLSVFKNKDNMWSVMRIHSKRVISKRKSKNEAIMKAISLAQREGDTEVVVYD